MFDIDNLIIDNIQGNCGSQYNDKVDIPNIQSVDVTSGISQPPLSHALYPPIVERFSLGRSGGKVVVGRDTRISSPALREVGAASRAASDRACRPV